jgi:chromosome partitioning protein
VRTVAVINSKGGSGKTTTAVSTAAALAERGLRVLLIDLDPQGSASDWLAASTTDRGLFDAFLGTRELASCARVTGIPRLEIVPSSSWLVTAERMLMGDLAMGVVRAFEKLRKSWDIVIVDCPPSLSYLCVGVLTSVREVVIPVEAHSIALAGVATIVNEIERLRGRLNPSLKPPVILPCRVNRTVHARQVVEKLRLDYDGLVARVAVRESIRFAEAASAHLPITLFDPTGGPSDDYRTFAAELVGRGLGPQAAGLRKLVFGRLLGRASPAEVGARSST